MIGNPLLWEGLNGKQACKAQSSAFCGEGQR